jgi:hypothetical protein
MSFYFQRRYYFGCFFQKKYLISLNFACDFQNYQNLEYSTAFKNQLMDPSSFAWFAAFIKKTSCNFSPYHAAQVFTVQDWKCISPFPFAEGITLVLFVYSIIFLFITSFISTEFHGFFFGFAKKAFLSFFHLFINFYSLKFQSL